MSLELDKAEWLKDIMEGSSSFLALAGESISEREIKRFEERLTKVKLTLDLYKTFGKAIVLHGVADAGSRLLFKFRSGTHGLNEELGKKVIKDVCCVVMSVRVSVMCCGSVQHIVTVELTSC